MRLARVPSLSSLSHPKLSSPCLPCAHSPLLPQVRQALGPEPQPSPHATHHPRWDLSGKQEVALLGWTQHLHLPLAQMSTSLPGGQAPLDLGLDPVGCRQDLESSEDENSARSWPWAWAATKAL